MAFALTVFVSAASGQIYPAGAPDVKRGLRERRACQKFLLFLAAAEEEDSSLGEAAASQESPLFRAVFAVWEHDREDKARLALVARVVAFYGLTERTGGAVLERWYDRNPESEETIFLHPAVIEAIATVPLGDRGQLRVEDFSRAVEAAAGTGAAHLQDGEGTLSKQPAEAGEKSWAGDGSWAEQTSWPEGEGELACLMRGFDWSATALGAVKGWPQSLKTAADLTLGCKFPMIVLWGEELIQIYNDGYRQIMGDKHPAGLGQATQNCWPEVWAINEPIYAKVLQGESVTFEDQLYPISRYGYLEDVYFTLCYSPLRNEQARVKGVLVTIFETTDRVLEQLAVQKAQTVAN